MRSSRLSPQMRCCTSSSRTPCRWRACAPIENQRPSSPRSRVQALIRPVRQGDGCGRSRDVPCFQRRLRRGYSPSEDGPSGPVSRRGVDARRFGGLAGIREENSLNQAPEAITLRHATLNEDGDRGLHRGADGQQPTAPPHRLGWRLRFGRCAYCVYCDCCDRVNAPK
jgi:hypothetical protein